MLSLECLPINSRTSTNLVEFSLQINIKVHNWSFCFPISSHIFLNVFYDPQKIGLTFDIEDIYVYQGL